MVSPSFLDSYLPYVLREADQTLSAPFYAVLTRYGVARSEWRVLAVLHDLGEMGILELATTALSPQPTVTHAVRRLEERELVTRRSGAADKRQRIVSLTDSGMRLTSALIQEAKRLETELLEGAGDLSGLIERLRELTDGIDARIAEAPQATEAV